LPFRIEEESYRAALRSQEVPLGDVSSLCPSPTSQESRSGGRSGGARFSSRQAHGVYPFGSSYIPGQPQKSTMKIPSWPPLSQHRIGPALRRAFLCTSLSGYPDFDDQLVAPGKLDHRNQFCSPPDRALQSIAVEWTPGGNFRIAPQPFACSVTSRSSRGLPFGFSRVCGWNSANRALFLGSWQRCIYDILRIDFSIALQQTL